MLACFSIKMAKKKYILLVKNLTRTNWMKQVLSINLDEEFDETSTLFCYRYVGYT